MTTRTNRNPGGLLDLLGAETGGANPQFYDDALRVSVDAAELYLGEALTSISQQYTSTTFGSNSAGCIVPAGETWVLRGLSAKCVNALATDSIGWEFIADNFPHPTGERDPASAPYVLSIQTPLFASEILSVPNAGDLVSAGKMLESPLSLASGMKLTCRTRSHTGAARTVTVHWIVNRLSRTQ